MNTSRFATESTSPWSVAPCELAPPTTAITPTNASAAYPISVRVRRSPKSRVATSRISAGWSAGMRVAFTIDVCWNEANPVTMLSAKQIAVGNAVRSKRNESRPPVR